MDAATNTARMIVALSLRDPACTWDVVAVGLSGARIAGRHAFRFPDGSAIAFTVSGLPVEFAGAEARA